MCQLYDILKNLWRESAICIIICHGNFIITYNNLINNGKILENKLHE